MVVMMVSSYNYFKNYNVFLNLKFIKLINNCKQYSKKSNYILTVDSRKIDNMANGHVIIYGEY